MCLVQVHTRPLFPNSSSILQLFLPSFRFSLFLKTEYPVNPLSAVYVFMGVRPPTGAWVTSQSPHPSRKLTVSLWVATYYQLLLR